MASTRPEALSRFGAHEQAVPRTKWGLAALSRLGSHVWKFVPAPLWRRLLLLFLLLSGVKLALLLTLGKHLFEIHWRVQATEISPLDYLSFAVFVLIGALILARLAHYCRSQGT